MAKKNVVPQTIGDYVKTLEGKTVEELTAIEQDIIAEMDKVDKEISEKVFKTDTAEYKELPYEPVRQAILALLDTEKVAWQATVALVAMYEFWRDRKDGDDIPFPVLDTTLRNLGTLEFTGYDQWKAVINVNAYFGPIRQEYIDTAKTIYELADKHNAVLQTLDRAKGEAQLDAPYEA